MSQIPKDTKSKYNKNDKFIWVDSQWEKLITEQKKLKVRIFELEEELEYVKERHNEICQPDFIIK